MPSAAHALRRYRHKQRRNVRLNNFEEKFSRIYLVENFLNDIPLDDALNSPERGEWPDVMINEVKSMQLNKIWKLVK